MDQVKNSVIERAGLAISAAASPLAKTTNALNAKIDGLVYPSVAAGNLPALTSAADLAASEQVIITVTLDKAGAFKMNYSSVSAIAQTDADSNTILFKLQDAAQVPYGEALVGYIVIQTNSSTTFTGGTTDLDAAGVTVSYLDVVAPFGY